MKKFIAWYSSLTHDQRKQFATMCNTLAAIVMVQISFKFFGDFSLSRCIIALIGFVASGWLWFVSIHIVKKKDGE